LRVLQLLSAASATISEGEVHQLLAKNHIETGQEEYLHIIASKTAQLFVAACQVGAIIEECSEAEERALAEYGRHLGVAFQIVDDVLDYSATQQKLGKSIGDDFAEGKVTLPVILAYAKGSEAERKFWQQAIENEQGDLNQALDIIHQNGVLPEAMKLAEYYADQAQKALSVFEEGEVKKALLSLAQFAIDRPY